MKKNAISYIVIFLGILIIFAFIAVIYGMYLKISINPKKLMESPIIFSSFIGEGEKIKNIEVINQNTLLILIDDGNNIKGAIYDINSSQITTFIEE